MGQPRLTQKEYFRRLFEKFPENEEKFNYEKFVYTKSNEKTIIICNAYGHEFSQAPGMHLRGCGCPDCNNMPISEEEYFEKLFERHPYNIEKFDYSDFHYIGTYEESLIRCNKHGHVFMQSGHEHMRGTGCPMCKVISMKI